MDNNDTSNDIIRDAIRKSISFGMRERVYDQAQMKALESNKVIVIFGAGRFSEWREMALGPFSYIAIDPNIDTSRLNKWGSGFHVTPYNFSESFDSQMEAASRRPSTVLWARCTSEDFLSKSCRLTTMASLGVPAVFPFSVSYHVTVINRLVEANVSVYGCGYVHDDMPAAGVGYSRASMTPRFDLEGRMIDVTAAVGKSVYIEPVLFTDSVPGIVWVKESAPDLWQEMDEKTDALMRRAVFMFSPVR
ncbi:hypothetical protein PENARI_c011G08394 [Penicillium arizonense]|jgi:hypothetical protein|uniref:Uncharacterized protein n=1 Tax=Penicillium arizonense TaxID=1835702 RepID=A0A1F5LFS7_PENAI|nr:hypothetical protein PENARI_c011G08394 [Penicillium arizonense]OGE52073.1 hypothetical protein PENARI_c011G08394 [Penicillium arizonense]